jgi:ABC-type transport system involved in Fe-S cluster assembly fused permease/ATPase subunit|tara:strand:- start:137 stop:382 length:246 start_codon:yes stop_codon:yes gene_type:complete
VFDEATSALDTQTEQSIIQTLADIDSNVTVMQVAHRVATLKDCDAIIELSDDRILGEGTFEDLISTSATFRDMATTAERVS